MASISKGGNGTKRIVFYDANRTRHFVRLGKIPMKTAETIKIHVESLVAAQTMKVSVDAETAHWVNSISDKIHRRLADTGLIPPRMAVGTLGEVIPQIIEEKAIDAKPATVEIWRQSESSLYRFFGEDRRIDQIAESEAKEFCRWLAKNGSLKQSTALKQSTVAKRMQHVHSFFLHLTRKGYIASNPFTGLAKKAEVNTKPNLYIEEERILRIMDHAPDAEWRLIIALWRFAGLRAASEVLSLKWEHILWDERMIEVQAPKTEHHQGKGSRKIPFFPHIEGCLREALEQAGKDAVYVVEKHAPLYLRGQKERVYISRQGNLGTVFKKIIRRAGHKPWKKLIHNLRASLETDLLNGKYGRFWLHTIAGWLGHSVKVMLTHYGRIQQADYDQIAQACKEAEERKEFGKRHTTAYFIPVKSLLDSENVDSNADFGVAQKASQYTAEEGGKVWNGEERPC